MIDPEVYTDELVSVQRTCRRCQRPTRNLEDGECDPDCDTPQELDRIKQRDAQRQLHVDTARLLRRLGFFERAAVHDQLAEGRW
jgi:hypothetical protein